MRKWWYVAILIAGSICVQGFATLTFVDQNYQAGYLNPGDQHILVQKIKIKGDTTPTLINAITVRNLGTATSAQVVRIEITDGEGVIGYANHPAGLGSAGITILTNYTAPANTQADINIYVDIASVEAIPSAGSTLILETKFHYEGMTEDSWVRDGASETILKAGFEHIDDGALGDNNFDPGDTAIVQSVTLFDNDANASPITVKEITVKNLGSATRDDLAVDGLSVFVTYNGSGGRQQLPTPAWCTGDRCWTDNGVVFDPNDFVVDDATSLTIEVEVHIADSPYNNHTIRTSIEISLEENGQEIVQTSLAPSTQTICVAGLEEVHDLSVVPTSRTVTSGEVLTQTLKLKDQDVNADGVEVNKIYVKNSGTATAQGNEIGEIIIRKDGTEIGRITNPANFLTQFIEIDLSTPFVIDDDSSATITVNYVIGNVTAGHTLQPVVQVGNTEPYRRGTDYRSESITYPEPVSLYPAGLEIVENVAPPNGPSGGECYTGQRLLAQEIRCVDKDQNSADVVINPIVIQNRGTAIGNSDVKKIEIKTASGKVLGETTDLTGFETGGVTISTLHNNVLHDSPSGTELILYIYVTIAGPEEGTAGNTVELNTTIFHTEEGRGYSRSVQGHEFTIVINHRPTVDFTVDPQIPNEGERVTFTSKVSDQDGDKITSYKWTFGDRGSTTSTEENPTHIYTQGGTFDVTLTATDSRGLEGSKTKTITVNRPPEVDFEWDPTVPDINQNVAFTSHVTDPDTPADTPFTYAWDFGDGATSDTANPRHAFAEMKSYDVKLTVTDARGGSATITHKVTVGNKPPVVDFTWEPTAPDTGERVTFTSTVTDPDTPPDTPFTYAWDFGDGTTSQIANPTHSFAEKKAYTVTLTVTDSRGGSTTVTKTLSVGNEPPVASFTVSDATPVVGETVQFTDTSSDPDGDDITAWQWDFGDETTADEQNPTHAYTVAGTYTVSLVVTDAKGGQSTAATQEITVTGPSNIVTYAYPNPATATATIVYYLPEGTTDLVLRVYDLVGNLVYEHDLAAAESTYDWDLTSTSGDELANGLYFYVVTGKDASGKAIRSAIFKLLIQR